MRLGGVASHDHDEIGVLDVRPGIGHRATAESWGQTGHRWAVSNSRLVVEGDDPQAPDDLVCEECGFVGGSRSGEEARRHPSVDRYAIFVFGDEVLVAVLLDELGDALHRPVPGDALPL